jgi:hypothetical protein
LRVFQILFSLKLDFSYNEIKSLPKFGVCKIKNDVNISELDLQFSDNKIEHLEEFFSSLNNFNKLENFSLILDNNSIRRIP